MFAMSSDRWTIFGATFGFTVFALFIQLNSAKNTTRHYNAFQNELSTIVSHNNSDFTTSHWNQLSKDMIELQIIQTVIDKFSALLSSIQNETHHRYKRGNFIPPAPSNNSNRLTMLENQLNKIQEQVAYLNSSTSLSTEDKSRISILETTIKEMQTTLDSYQKENSETIQVIINKLETTILIGMIQSIKSGQFSFAEEHLQLTDDSIFKKIVQKVYNNEIDNIDSLLRFGGSITDLEKKYKLYEALYYEIRNNGNIEIQALLRLGKTLRIGIFELGTGTIRDRTQSLIRTLWEENRNSSVTLITAAFLKNESWSLVKQIKDEIHRSSGLKFLGDIYKEVMVKVMDTLSIENILTKVDQNLNITEERIMIYEGIINMERNGSLHDDPVVILVRHMKKTWDDPEFNNEDWRYQYKIIINKLPRSLRYIVHSSSVCIKNTHYNEYMYAADSDGKQRVFTGKLKNNNISPEFKWKLRFTREFWITIRNVQYNKFLNYVSSNNCNKCFDAIIDSSSCTWHVKVDGEGVQLSYFSDDNYLFVDDKKRDDNMRYVFIYNNPAGKPPYPSTWELVDCSDIS